MDEISGYVVDVSDLDTDCTCDGCGLSLSLLTNYLAVSLRGQRGEIQQVDLRLVGAITDDQGQITELAPDLTPDQQADPIRYGLAFQKFESFMLNFHSPACVALWANAQPDQVSAAPHAIDADADGRSNA